MFNYFTYQTVSPPIPFHHLPLPPSSTSPLHPMESQQSLSHLLMKDQGPHYYI